MAHFNSTFILLDWIHKNAKPLSLGLMDACLSIERKVCKNSATVTVTIVARSA